jgi:hypothetical protein
VDVVLSVPLFVGFAFAAIVALFLLKRTKFFWIPGVALMAYGVAIYIAWSWYDTHEDVGGLEGLSNGLHVAASFVVVAGGVVCLLIGARSHKRAHPEIPTAVAKE